MHTSTSPARKFACPFFQRNPDENGLVAACGGFGWNETHRVKEHIYRCHTPSQNNKKKKRSPDPGQRLIRFIDDEQEKMLRSKRHSRSNEEDKWREIYRICFPKDDKNNIPSPYRDGLKPGVFIYPGSKHQFHFLKLLREKYQARFPRIGEDILEELMEISQQTYVELFNIPMSGNPSEMNLVVSNSTGSISTMRTTMTTESHIPEFQSSVIHDAGRYMNGGSIPNEQVWTQQIPMNDIYEATNTSIHVPTLTMSQYIDPSLGYSTPMEE